MKNVSRYRTSINSDAIINFIYVVIRKLNLPISIWNAGKSQNNFCIFQLIS